MNFESDINNFTRDAIAKHFVKFRRNVALSLFRAVVKASPVGNPDLWKINEGKNGDDDGSNNILAPEGYVGGRFRANWMCSLNGLDKSTTTSTNQAGALTLIATKTKASKPHDTICLTNSLPYAIKLEYEGHSSQTPNGMVRLNVARFKTIIAEEVAKLR